MHKIVVPKQPVPWLQQVQARYIVERMDTDLWAKVLDEDNAFRRQLIDQVGVSGSLLASTAGQ